MQVVTVLNRSSKDLYATWDGKPHLLPAHEKVALPLVVAEAARRQNVVMGSEDPYTGEMEYLVAIIEHGDPTDPIEQTRSITRMNRVPLKVKDEVVVEGKNGLYGRQNLADPPAVSTGPITSGFVDPTK